MEPIKTTGLVLRKARFKEAHEMLTVLTEAVGKVSVYAPGIRSLKNKNFAAGDLLRYGEFVLKPGKTGMFSLTEFTPLANFSGITRDLHRLETACFMAELSERIAPEGEPMPNLLRLCLNTLHFLAKTDRSPDALRLGFEIGALRESGLGSDLTRCIQCGSREGLLRFNASAGGITCLFCGGTVLSREAYQLLLLTDTDLMTPLFKFQADDETIAYALRYTESMIKVHLSSNLKHLETLNSLFPTKQL